MPRQKTTLGEIVSSFEENLCPDQWSDMDNLRADVRKKNLVDLSDPEVRDSLCDFAITALIRRSMRRKGPDGYPLFPNISVPSKDGERNSRRYMNVKKMKKIHFNQFGGDCHGKVVYWMRMENATARKSHEKFGNGEQLMLPWPEVV